MRVKACWSFVTVATISLLACRDAQGPGGLGGLTLLLSVESSSQVDQYRAVIQGPTSRTITATPGTVDTITVSAGTYTVTVEGLVNGLVDVLDAQTGIQVRENQFTTVQLQLRGFTPTLTPLISPTTLTDVGVSYSSVVGAEAYDVEWSLDTGFGSPSSKRVTGTSTTITLTGFALYFVRVQAVSALGSEGTWSNAEPVDVRDWGDALQRIDGLTRDEFVNAILGAIDPSTAVSLQSLFAAIQNAIVLGDIGAVQQGLADAQTAVDASSVPADVELAAVLGLVLDYMQRLVP